MEKHEGPKVGSYEDLPMRAQLLAHHREVMHHAAIRYWKEPLGHKAEQIAEATARHELLRLFDQSSLSVADTALWQSSLLRGRRPDLR